MARPFGELKLAERYDELRNELQNYYGAINEIRYGLQVRVPEKPDVLIYLEQIETLHALPRKGGLEDQPYILMREIHIAAEIRDVFQAMWQQQQAQQPQGV